MKNGSLLMPFQTWLPNKPCTRPACITVVSAPSWRAWPYSTYPLGLPGNSSQNCVEREDPGHPGSVEDPSNIWRDARGRLHMLMHKHVHGGRARQHREVPRRRSGHKPRGRQPCDVVWRASCVMVIKGNRVTWSMVRRA